MAERITVKTQELKTLVIRIFENVGLSSEDAEVTAEVLLCGDRRGIESHGVARLKRYVDGIKNGIMKTSPDIKTIVETPVSLVIDGDGGMGQVVGHFAMQRCIQKAKENYMCFAAVRNSNHYGIAGYYALTALTENLIGVSFTNSAPLVVPTYGKDAVLGTNPISFGFPTRNEKPYLLDMATSTVPRGKLEVKARLNEPIPNTWATDSQGEPTTDAHLVLENLLERKGGGLLPIGGAGEENGGHKGFGLAAIVDIFTGVLSGGAVGTDVYGKKGKPAEVAHFFGAINPAAFLGEDALKDKMDYFINMLKTSHLADQESRIYVAGEKEYEKAQSHQEKLTLNPTVFETINEIGKEYGLELKAV